MTEQDFDDVQTGLAATLYYLYRVAGCPLGNSMSGFNAWIEMQREQFSAFAEQECPNEN